jgi:hypothetical protein
MINPIQVTVHRIGAGTCSLTGKEAVDGLTVTIDGGSVTQAHLSWKSFKQLLSLQFARFSQSEPKTPGAAGANATVSVAAK